MVQAPSDILDLSIQSAAAFLLQQLSPVIASNKMAAVDADKKVCFML